MNLLQISIVLKCFFSMWKVWISEKILCVWKKKLSKFAKTPLSKPENESWCYFPNWVTVSYFYVWNSWNWQILVSHFLFYKEQIYHQHTVSTPCFQILGNNFPVNLIQDDTKRQQMWEVTQLLMVSVCGMLVKKDWTSKLAIKSLWSKLEISFAKLRVLNSMIIACMWCQN